MLCDVDVQVEKDTVVRNAIRVNFAVDRGPKVKIKAAGGISTLEDLEAFLNLGCDRIGTSRAVGLLKGEMTEGY